MAAVYTPAKGVGTSSAGSVAGSSSATAGTAGTGSGGRRSLARGDPTPPSLGGRPTPHGNGHHHHVHHHLSHLVVEAGGHDHWANEVLSAVGGNNGVISSGAPLSASSVCSGSNSPSGSTSSSSCGGHGFAPNQRQAAGSPLFQGTAPVNISPQGYEECQGVGNLGDAVSGLGGDLCQDAAPGPGKWRPLEGQALKTWVSVKVLEKKRKFHSGRPLELKNLPDGCTDQVGRERIAVCSGNTGNSNLETVRNFAKV